MEKSENNEGPDLDRIGLFKEMSYHHEYVPVKISFNDPSKKGKQMMTNCSKSKAGNQDGFFDPTFSRAFEGEGYFDRLRVNRLNRLESAKKSLEPHFKYSSPTKKPSGKGSNYGTFSNYGDKVPHFSSKSADLVPTAPEKKNFFTNPPKKGTGYGYPNLTIGKQPPYFLEQEYEELKNAPREPQRPQPRPFQPYRAGIYQQEYFDPNPYRPYGEVSEVEEHAATETAEGKAPFIPSSPAKRDGGMKAGCLSSFPLHESDPIPRIELVPRGVKHYVNAENKMFRPVPGVRPYPVKSIINKNVQRKVTPQNFTTIKGVVYCNNVAGKKPKK